MQNDALYGHHNTGSVFRIGGQGLEALVEEKDQGVVDFRVSKQCIKASRTANQVMGMISRTFTSRSWDIILTLYKAFVKPHSEYCI